jgi:hypothetical protein
MRFELFQEKKTSKLLDFAVLCFENNPKKLQQIL